MTRERTGRFHGEAGKFNGTIVLIVIFFTVLGVAVIDGGSILFGKLQLRDLAETAASEAASEFQKSNSEAAAFNAAKALVSERDPAVTLDKDSFDAATDTESVTLTLTKDASVLFIDKIPPLQPFVHMTATVTTPATII